MLTFPRPSVLHGDNLKTELTSAGYQDVEVYDLGDEMRVRALTSGGNPVGEQSRSAIQSVIDAHGGQMTEEQLRPGRIRQKIEAGITRLEGDAKDSATWDGLTAARRQENARIACLMAAKLARLALAKFDVPEA